MQCFSASCLYVYQLFIFLATLEFPVEIDLYSNASRNTKKSQGFCLLACSLSFKTCIFFPEKSTFVFKCSHFNQVIVILNINSGSETHDHPTVTWRFNEHKP